MRSLIAEPHDGGGWALVDGGGTTLLVLFLIGVLVLGAWWNSRRGITLNRDRRDWE